MVLTVLGFYGTLANAKDSNKPHRSEQSEHSAVDRSSSRIAVDRFTGRGALNVARAGVIFALEEEDRVDVVSVRLLEAQRASLDGSPAGYAKVAKELDLTHILRGKVKSSDDGAHITLTLVSGADGRTLGTLSFEAKSMTELRDKLHKQLWAELEPLLQHGEPEAEPEEPPEPAQPEAEPEPETTPEPVLDVKKKEHAHPAGADESAPLARPPARAERCTQLAFELLGGAQTRTFNYVNEQRGALRADSSTPTPVGRGELAWYPLASRACGARGGIALGYERALLIHSDLAGRSLSTSAFAGHAELVVALRASVFTFEPGIGYSEQHFAIDGGIVPKVDYHAARARLLARAELGPMSLELRGGGRLLLGAGQLSSAAWFPRARGRGYEAGARLGVKLEPFLELFLDARLQYYRLDLRATDAGPYPNGVAEAAFDRYLDGSLGLKLFF